MDQPKKVQVKTLSGTNVLLGVAVGLLFIGAGFAAALLTNQPKSVNKTAPVGTVRTPNENIVYEAVGIDGARVYILDQDDRIESLPVKPCQDKNTYWRQGFATLNQLKYPIYCARVVKDPKSQITCFAVNPKNQPVIDQTNRCVIVLSSEDDDWVY